MFRVFVGKANQLNLGGKMNITRTVFNSFKVSLCKKEIDCLNDAFKARLMKSAYTFSQSGEVWTDVSSGEVPVGNGYPSGGYSLPAPTITKDNVNNRAEIFWSGELFNIVASGGDISDIKGIIIYDDTHPNDKLFGYAEFSEVVTLTNGTTAKIIDMYYRLS
jgi:hypothetical protein